MKNKKEYDTILISKTIFDDAHHERLAEEGRVDGLIRAAKDPVFRQELIEEYRPTI